MIRWCLSNWVRLSNPASDPSDVLIDLWLHLRWPLVGIGLFVIATLWSVATGLRLLAQAPRDGVPPRIEPR
jgi:hypothetical protein